MADLQPKPASFRPAPGRAIRLERGFTYLAGALLALVFALPKTSDASAHHDSRLTGAWPRATAELRKPGISDEQIAAAARLDLAEQPGVPSDSSFAFARWLRVTVSDPSMGLDVERGTNILQCFMSESGQKSTTFWSEFSLAAFQRMAGEHRAAANSLARALTHAGPERVSSNIVARTTAIMGHTQQAGGLLDQARKTFEGLENDPAERGHATVHLGEIALSTGGVGAGLDVWLNHPGGTVVGVAVITEEADALWESHPDQSYRLVAEALGRIRQQRDMVISPDLAAALGRLEARRRENAMALH
jgi:hypothetical protein